jgi:hypothetical protein
MRALSVYKKQRKKEAAPRAFFRASSRRRFLMVKLPILKVLRYYKF